MNLYNQFNHLLEYAPKENICTQNTNNEILYKDLLDFVKKYNLTKILISLSGGVDSMVLFDILHHIKQYDINELNIYICHIDYNNRPESNDEKDFLIQYIRIILVFTHSLILTYAMNTSCLDFPGSGGVCLMTSYLVSGFPHQGTT